MRTRTAVVATLLVVLAGGAAPAAQYFGQNKVQYERFDFQVQRTAHFDIYFYPEERQSVAHVARMAESWYTKLTTAFGLPLTTRQPLVMYASQPHFAQTQVIEGILGEGTGGVTEFLKRRMVLPFASTLGETDHVLGHEMVHAFQFDHGGQGALALPLWFIEGMAEYLTLGPDHPPTAMWLRSWARDEELPGFEDLDHPKYFPYRFGHAAWAFLTSRFGEGIVATAFLAAVEAKDPLTGIEQATGQDIESLSKAWQQSIRERHGATAAAEPPGREIVSGDSPRSGRLHVSPALSPDGRRLVYLSERDPFSLDLVLAEAESGRVVRRLTKSATDPHLESLQFVASAGGWDSASQRFAYTTVQRGRATLTIVDAAGSGASREITIAAADEAWHPTWSPDGRSIAFAGHEGGVTDLFVLDVQSGAVRRITNDPFADLQPAWSPTGDRIAFVTDRYTTNLERLQFGQLQPATIAPDGSGLTRLPVLERARHINPQWAKETGSLVLVADPDGVPNVYRLDIGAGRYEQVTSVETGVSGLTPLSPAISFAPEAGRIAYGVFTDGGYDIRIADLPAQAPAPRAPVRQGLLFAGRAEPVPRTVPPADSVTGEVSDYKPKLALDFAGASGGIGTSGVTGAFAAGGIGFQFSDVLGEHTLSFVVEANGGIRDIGGQVGYINRTSRWNWGLIGGMQPYVSGGFGQSLDIINGIPVVVEQSLILRQTDLEARAIAMYPFSRALRFEVQGGGRRIWFDRELITRVFSLDTGDFLDEEREEFDAPDSLNLGEATAALVYDQSSFGPVGPVRGQRYRLDVTPTFGSLQFTSLVADFRRYLGGVRPFTLAVRALHVGRYGRDAEDTRLSPLFLGYPSLVRGYDVDTFDGGECGNGIDGSCPSFDRLVGSRVLVGNAELRFPLLGLFSLDYRYGPIPLEGFLFADSGVAWQQGQQPGFSNGDRTFVSSVGGGVRVNVFGYMVVQLAGAKPLDRLNRRWRFVFDFMPAF